jgi:GNAT superfamily N-acetyltransferase
MIEIRNAVADNVPGLAILFDNYRVFYQKPTDVLLAKEFLKERIENKESVIFISFEEKQMTGFVQLYPLFSSTRMKRLWLLNDLFVSPGSRGRGISIALIDRAKEH